jgi:hypothetical protein
MDHRPHTIEQRHSPIGRGGARAAPDRLPPEPVRAAALPVRRSGALEAAAHALDARGLGGALALGQAEDEWGAARSHLGPPPGAARDDARVRAASAIASRGALLTGTPCARDRTTDGRPGWGGAWWISPGEAAWRDEPRVKRCWPCTRAGRGRPRRRGHERRSHGPRAR